MTILEQAAHCANRDLAASAILSGLKITDTAVCVACLSTPQDWRKLSYEQRLQEIGDWLRSECFASIERREDATTRMIAQRRAPLRLVRDATATAGE